MLLTIVLKSRLTLMKSIHVWETAIPMTLRIRGLQSPHKYGKGSNPCWVYGSAGYSWFLCERKKKGRCAACGSEAHITKLCAQRYFAHPSYFASNNGDATQFTAKKASRCMHCDCPYQDCQEEEEIPSELEPQEEEQPQTKIDLACASVQIVHALLAADRHHFLSQRTPLSKS